MSVQAIPGYIQGRGNTFADGEPLPSQMVNLLQDDAARLSNALVQTIGLLYGPIVFTSNWKMPVTSAVDRVTLEDNIQFLVGGMLFTTHDLATRIIEIPDNSTRFVRLEVDSGCGLLQAYETASGVVADPLERNLAAKLVVTAGQETDQAGAGGGPSTAGSMLVLKAVKGVAGSTPLVTLYVNQPTLLTPSGSETTQTDDLPIGAILPFGIETLPADCNWMECNGAQVAIADYPALYAAVANAFGVADSGNFRLPDLRGRFPRGWDHGAGHDPEASTRSGGDKVGSTQEDGVKQHSHVFTQYSFGDATGNEVFLGQGRYPGTSANFGTGVNADLNAYETRPKNVAVMYCIKWR